MSSGDQMYTQAHSDARCYTCLVPVKRSLVIYLVKVRFVSCCSEEVFLLRSIYLSMS